MSLRIEGISNNMRYLFTNKGVVSLTEELNDLNGKNVAQYTFENLNIAVDIMRENMEFDFLTKKIDIQEYAFASRKFLNMLMETFDPDNKINIIKEWEMKFGNGLMLINESMDDVLRKSRVDESWNAIRTIVEQWYNPLDWAKGAAGLVKKGVENVGKYAYDTAKSVKDFGVSQYQQLKQIKNADDFKKYISSKAKSVWNRVKNGITKAWNCIKANPVECIMEGLRTVAFSAIGSGALTAVSFIPVVGQVSNALIFGSLLIWDAYKIYSGKYESGEYAWNVFDILFSMVSLLLPVGGSMLKQGAVGLRSFKDFGVMALKKGGIFKTILNAIKSGGAKLARFIANAANWLGDKLGLEFLKNFASNATQWATKVSDEIIAGANSVATTGAVTGAQGISNLGDLRRFIPKSLLKPDAFKLIAPKGVVLNASGVAIAIDAVICAAMGVDDPIMCKNKIEDSDMSQEEFADMKEEYMVELKKQMGQLPID